jgi:pimeloyl-ACP methyl ester carboxylesterase
MDKLQSTFLDIDGIKIYTWQLRATKPRADRLTLVILHGAGQSNRERFTAFARMFADKGVTVIGLDFLGHGKTGGELSGNSLSLRVRHALGIIAHWTEAMTPLVLCGSSMSGQTALRVAGRLGSQVKNLCLLQPAVYAAEAEDVPFGPDFTAILHQQGSWRSSLALKDAAGFAGNAYIAIGTDDAVIPWQVIEELTVALKTQSRLVRLEVFGGVGHELPTWIPRHSLPATQLVAFLTDI